MLLPLRHTTQAGEWDTNSPRRVTDQGHPVRQVTPVSPEGLGGADAPLPASKATLTPEEAAYALHLQGLGERVQNVDLVTD